MQPYLSNELTSVQQKKQIIVYLIGQIFQMLFFPFQNSLNSLRRTYNVNVNKKKKSVDKKMNNNKKEPFT